MQVMGKRRRQLAQKGRNVATTVAYQACTCVALNLEPPHTNGGQQ